MQNDKVELLKKLLDDYVQEQAPQQSAGEGMLTQVQMMLDGLKGQLTDGSARLTRITVSPHNIVIKWVDRVAETSQGESDQEISNPPAG